MHLSYLSQVYLYPTVYFVSLVLLFVLAHYMNTFSLIHNYDNILMKCFLYYCIIFVL